MLKEREGLNNKETIKLTFLSKNQRTLQHMSLMVHKFDLKEFKTFFVNL